MSSESEGLSYFQKRLFDLGIKRKEQHTVSNYEYGAFKRGDEKFQECSFEIFQEDKEGNIRIYYPTLEGLKAQHRKGDAKNTTDYFITRLKEPKGDMKYVLPGKSGSIPFLPPGLIQKYQEKTEIKTLYITEGAIKAFKAEMHGIDIIGLSSITHAKDRYTLGLHEDIRTIIKTCKVQRVVWLIDGDCNRLSSKKLEDIKDLYTRPNQFFHSACTVRTFLSEFDNVEKWFVHPISDDLEELGNPKGIDDLLIALKGQEEVVVADLNNYSKKGKWTYFNKLDMTYSTGPLYKYFHLGNVLDFYLFHIERRKELAQAKDFVFQGTRYRYNNDKNICEVIIPGDAKNYFRVGDQYFEKIHIPNKYKELEYTFHRRQKSTIQDDYGRDFTKHIPKYKAFCNAPDHINYSEVIHSCFNVYAPFEHEPDEEGSCNNTLEFIKHIFGTKELTYKNKKGEKQTITEYDLGLDYLQLLYQQPTQILPILCLVSKENGTGKSTFAKWLKMIFTQNVAIVGNADLENDFNAAWSTRLLVVCDEAKIDKSKVVEKVKMLSTADKVLVNSKGKDQFEIDFFGKFILLSNNEDNFVYASEDDVRWWIRKIPVITTLNVDLLQSLLNEIPFFLHFLNKRKMVTDQMHRAWFEPELIKTEALTRVMLNSKPTIEKEIRERIREMFFDFTKYDEFLFAPKCLNREFFKEKYELNYITKVLKEMMKLDVVVNDEGQSIAARYVFPRWEHKPVEGRVEQVEVEIRDIGRPFRFPIAKFLSIDEIQSRAVEPIVRELEGESFLRMDEKKDNDLPF